MQQNPAIAYEVLNILKNAMGEDFDNLIPIFIASGLQTLTGLEQAFVQGNIEAFMRQAHNLKASSADLGGKGLSRMAATLEQAGKLGKLPNSKEFIEPLREEFDRMEVALQKFGV